ncbi:MAG: long-chain fatty acid--CoA ligase, partial [Paenisporosarcina sp.]
VAAIIVSKTGEPINKEELLSYCKERLAGYKVPKIFFYADVLPRNASGKILKYQLRESFNKQVIA